MSDTTGFSDFDAYRNETRERLLWILHATQVVSSAKETPEFIISLIGIFLNIFHLIILTRKSMRSTSINVLMIGIAISDLFVMIFWSFIKVFVDSTRWNNDCVAPNGFWTMILEDFTDSTKDVFRRVSPWLGVLMAVIRFLIIKNPLNPRFDFLSRTSFSWNIILIITFLSSLFSALFFLQFQINELPAWTPPEQCPGFPENYTEEQFTIVMASWEQNSLELFYEVYYIIEEILKIVPAILLPILAFLLIRELKKATKARRNLLSSQGNGKDHTTNLVFLMTVSFVISELPLGITFAATGYFATDPGFGEICVNLTMFLNIFVALNATTHCLICMTMSSQYRNCVKNLFCKNVKPTVVKVSSKSSPNPNCGRDKMSLAPNFEDISPQ